MREKSTILMMGTKLLNTEMGLDSVIKTCKGYQPISPSQHTATPDSTGQTVTSSDRNKSSTRGCCQRDPQARPSLSAADVRHQQRPDSSKTAIPSTRVRPPTPIWVEGRYTPVFDTSPIVTHKEETLTRVVKLADPQPKKTSKMKRFFNGVSRFLRETRHQRKGWTRF
ncbi:uncharacterized protein LOC124273383 [Haliotis rubra]|uniref:uncharacterized protein LOC124273383 n=1 Tax=Haliotis rubra TaxID=36100 RepID=UPI001EE59DC7|nr:uncharacterized protein LOC124273383 [Haliotis rubra]